MKNLLNKIKELFKKKELVDVISRHEGKVVSVGKNKPSGKYIKFTDDKGFNHFYGHLAKVNFKLGDVVRVGDVIGEKYKNGSHL